MKDAADRQETFDDWHVVEERLPPIPPGTRSQPLTSIGVWRHVSTMLGLPIWLALTIWSLASQIIQYADPSWASENSHLMLPCAFLLFPVGALLLWCEWNFFIRPRAEFGLTLGLGLMTIGCIVAVVTLAAWSMNGTEDEVGCGRQAVLVGVTNMFLFVGGGHVLGAFELLPDEK